MSEHKLIEDNDSLWKSASDKVSLFEKEVLKKVLLHCRLAESFMIGLPEAGPSYFAAKMSPENLFKDTPYEYSGNGEFIHFSSLLGIKAILDSGWLRMSEFGNLFDSNELVYAAKVFADNPRYSPDIEKIQDIKYNVFCLSACKEIKTFF